MNTLSQILPYAFAVLMLVAAFFDLLTMTIPNRLTLLVAALFAVAAFAAGLGWPAAGWHVLAGIGVLAVCFALFALGWIGGGDAKLAAAIGLWAGPFMVLLEWALMAAVFGGVLTLLLLAFRMLPLPAALYRVEWVARLHDRKTGIPYGIALAAAALWVLPNLPVIQQLAV